MRQLPPPHGSPDDTENAFYDALSQGDVERVMACWAEEEDIVCVLPGGPRLVGHAAVRAALELLLADGGVTAVPEQLHRLDTGSCRVHSVVERVAVAGHDAAGVAWVMATNVYAKTAHGWRMVVHHASPGAAAEPAAMPGSPRLLH